MCSRAPGVRNDLQRYSDMLEAGDSLEQGRGRVSPRHPLLSMPSTAVNGDVFLIPNFFVLYPPKNPGHGNFLFCSQKKKRMHRSGFEPELLAWKAKVIATRPSVQVSLRCIKGYKKLYLKGCVTKNSLKNRFHPL